MKGEGYKVQSKLTYLLSTIYKMYEQPLLLLGSGYICPPVRGTRPAETGTGIYVSILARDGATDGASCASAPLFAL
jgi:hypothetical protein